MVSWVFVRKRHNSNSHQRRASLLLVLLLDAALALGVDEATSRAGATLAAEFRLAGAGGVALANSAANEEEDGCEQVGEPGCPHPAKGVFADGGRHAVRAESIAALDVGCT